MKNAVLFRSTFALCLPLATLAMSPRLASAAASCPAQPACESQPDGGAYRSCDRIQQPAGERSQGLRWRGSARQAVANRSKRGDQADV